jgi:hypothetical protein
MAHFAQLDQTNKVISVHVVHDSVAIDEVTGVEFLTQIVGGNGWFKQTYLDGSSRKNYAGVGDSYDGTKDAFIPHKPHPSWKLNEDSCQWEAPVAYPEDGKHYAWDEPNKDWVEAT